MTSPEDRQKPSPTPQNTLSKHQSETQDELSSWAKVAGTLTIVTCLSVCIYTQPAAVTWFPVILAPTYIGLHLRKSRLANKRGDLEMALWAYLFTATISTVLVMCVQLILGLAFAHVLFGKDTEWFLNEFQTVSREDQIRDDAHRALREEFVARPTYWLFLFLSTFVIAGLCEEVQKYLSLLLAKRLKQGNLTDSEHVVCGIAVGLGFSTMENMAFIMAQQHKSGSELAFTVFERLLLGTPAHVLCGMSTALAMVRQKRDAPIGILGVIGRSAFFHGAVNFGLLVHSALKGHVGWIHPDDWAGILTCLILSGSGQLLLALLVRADIRKLKKD